MWTKRFIIIGFIFLCVVFLETLFRMNALHLGFDGAFLRIIVFSLFYAVFISLIVFVFSVRTMRALLVTILIGLTTFYLSQDIYYHIMDELYSFSIAGDVGRGLAFFSRIFINLSFVHLLYFVPLLVLIYTRGKQRSFYLNTLACRYNSTKSIIIMGLSVYLLFILSMTTISTNPMIDDIDDPYNYSQRDLYEAMPSPYLVARNFGAMTYARLDFQSLFAGSDDPEVIDEFIQSYLNSKLPHNTNAQTGLFRDKNFIMIIAESLDYLSVDPDFMPTLYAMQENSLNFHNFYAPHYYRNTADTEFMTFTSFYPSRNVQLSMRYFEDNTFPNTLPRLLREKDYISHAYHNYTDYFYPRDVFHPDTIGFDTYTNAVDMGMMPEPSGGIASEHPWQSDLEMIELTLDDLLSEDKFFGYYLSVSGHMDYDINHPIVEKNLPIIEDILEETERDIEADEVKAYLASQYELDLALAYLLERLEEENLADDTVVMVMSDHYPYGLSHEQIAAYQTHRDLEESSLHIHNVPMLIYHPSLSKQTIEKPFASLDVLPTLANLFALNMDYNQVLGIDVFSNHNAEIRFQNSSILTEHYLFDVERNDLIHIYNDDYNEADVRLHYNRLIHKQRISNYILQSDYFNPNRATFDIKNALID